jgi:PAS domain S-box-containing protein
MQKMDPFSSSDRQQHRLSMALQVGRMALWDWDLATDQLTWSANCAAFFGLAEDDWPTTATGFRQLLTTEDERALARALRQALAARRACHLEFRLRRPDESYIWVALSAEGEYDETDQPVRLVGLLQNIAERKAAEQWAFHAHLLHHLEDGVIATDPNYVLTAWNRGAERLYGWRAEEVIGRPLREVLRSEMDSATRTRAYQQIEASGFVRAEAAIRDRQGKLLTVEGINVALRAEDGAVTGYLSIHRDMTERRQAGEALRDSEERFRAIFEHAAVGVAQVALDGTILRANPYLADLTGYTVEELAQQNVRDITHPDDMAEQRRYMAQLEQGELTHYALEKRYRRKNGGVTWVNLSTSIVRDRVTGRPLYYISAIENINERKEAEARLRFLAQASLELVSSLDYRQALQPVAALVVSQLADWCTIDLLNPQGILELVAAAHTDPQKVQWAYDFRQRHALPLHAVSASKVVRTGETQLYPTITPEFVATGVADDEQRTQLLSLDLASAIIVPLTARGQTIGVLTLARAASQPRYQAADVGFVEEVARRIASTIDNARLFAEARLAEQQQAELLAQLEALFANAPIGIAFFDRQLRYVRVNEALAAMNGLPIEDHLEHTLYEILPHAADYLAPPIQQVFESGQGLYNQEVSGVRAERPGRRRYALASWYPVLVEKGRSRYVGAMVLDITDRKYAEEALRASEERFRATFEQAAVGLAHVGLDGAWLRVNHRLCEIVGYTRQELLGKTFQAITHPDDLALELEKTRQLLAGEIDGYHLEKRYLRADGTPLWVNLTVSLVRNAAQQPDYFIRVVEDIAARKAAELQLRVLAETSQVLTSSLLVGQMTRAVADLVVPSLADWCAVNLLRNGTIELAAAAHQDHTKLERLQALAVQYPLDPTATSGTPYVIRTGQILVYPTNGADSESSDQVLAELSMLGLYSMVIVPLEARQQMLGALTLARSNDRVPFDDEEIHFVADLGRRIALAIDNARLYEETRTAATQLRQWNETLEARVTERTAELERSNRELNQFAYVASHDLRAPLRAIENLAQWITEDAESLLPEASRGHLLKLRGRVRRMERLLDDLLAYSRAGRTAHQPQRVETVALVKGIVELLAPPLTFTVIVDPALPTLYTARVPLETVLRNLINNAIKHHRGGAGQIIIRANRQGPLYEFIVEDDGPGIAPEFHARIFEMFQTLQPRDQVEGSGMGLAIVKKIVLSQGGDVWVDSAEGRGARFHFTWPV